MGGPVEIVGAGPAGLAAALTVVRYGRQAIVYERGDEVGRRFHGDFQGLENWTTRRDVLEELEDFGISPDFEHTPFRECLFWDAVGREYCVRSDRPLFYLVRRGPDPGSFDRSLKEKALAAGVEIRFQSPRTALGEGGIVAKGPDRADAIATGYIFDTDAPDGIFTVSSDRLAPGGYAYLLLRGGRGTVASCMFRAFSDKNLHVERTLEFFREKVGLQMGNARPFGGFCKLYHKGSARMGNQLYAGEAAGFQDALLGFGMRFAILSGYLAARALLEGDGSDYDHLWQQRFGRLLKLGAVNRRLYDMFGDRGYACLLRRVGGAADARDWLRRYYGRGRLKSLFYPLVRQFEPKGGCP